MAGEPYVNNFLGFTNDELDTTQFLMVDRFWLRYYYQAVGELAYNQVFTALGAGSLDRTRHRLVRFGERRRVL